MADKANEILLNIMFKGDYLKGNNIGHEIINLFKADNGKNYIYVLPWGTMAKEHNGKIKSILLVRRLSVKVFEVLAKADRKLTQITEILSTIKDEKHYAEVLEYTRNFVVNNDIKYNGVFLNDIFAENVYNDNKDIQNIPFTFEVGRVIKPKKPIFITIDKNIAEKEDYLFVGEADGGIKHFASQSSKMYITEKTPSAYNALERIITDETLWGGEVKTLNEEKQRLLNEHRDNGSFIEILKKEHDELSYSNMFAYFFEENREGFQKFAREILVVNNFSRDYVIKREKAHIDLWIEDEKNIVIIENKIKSGINGIAMDNNGNVKKSQLSEYYEKARKSAGERDKKLSCYLFVPDYNHINLDDYEHGEEYKLKKYSEIYDFFNANIGMYKNKGVCYGYFDEFLRALKIHTRPVDNSNEEEMYERFIVAIERAKERQIVNDKAVQ